MSVVLDTNFSPLNSTHNAGAINTDEKIPINKPKIIGKANSWIDTTPIIASTVIGTSVVKVVNTVRVKELRIDEFAISHK